MVVPCQRGTEEEEFGGSTAWSQVRDKEIGGRERVKGMMFFFYYFEVQI